MLITPSFKKVLIVEQFQGSYLNSVYLFARLSLPVTLVTFELTIFCYFKMAPLFFVKLFFVYFSFAKKCVCVGWGGGEGGLKPPPSPSLCAVPVQSVCETAPKSLF